MENLSVLSESELRQKIIAAFQKEGIDFSMSHPIPSKAKGSSSKRISSDVCDQVLSFFKKDLWSFAKSLEKFSNELTKTLDFDVHEIYTKIASSSEEIAQEADKVVEKLPKNTEKMIKEMFRYVLWPWIKNSYFVNRGLLKPHGFPGDYIIVEAMYDGNAKSLGLGYIYDTIFLNTQLCQGLRNRKDQMKQILSNYLNQKKRKKNIKIFNVGCGGSRELREISVPGGGEGIKIYLMDFDPKALAFSKTHLQSKLPNAEIVSLNIDVREIVVKKGVSKLNIDQCDLIYSIGLFDYLPDRVILKLLGNLTDLLSEEGLLIFAHKDHLIYNPRIADWFCDWKYYDRSQKDFENIFKNLGIDPANISFSREKDGYIFFVKIRKTSANKKMQ